MIKLIVADMDGTLLNSKKELPARTFEIIDQLKEQGIIFAVASGRQSQSLLRIYDDIKDKIIIVADNGGTVFDSGELIFNDFMDLEDVREIVEAVEAIPRVKITICGLQSAYMFGDDLLQEISHDLVKDYFPVYTVINNLDELSTDEQVVKLAIFDPEYNAKVNIYEKLKYLEEKYQIAVSSIEWTDIMNAGMNKGLAIQKLQERFNITIAETMAFGDEKNDYEMMQQAYYSYAMANAIPEIKKISNFITLSNDEQGVIKVLEELLEKIRM